MKHLIYNYQSVLKLWQYTIYWGCKLFRGVVMPSKCGFCIYFIETNLPLTTDHNIVTVSPITWIISQTQNCFPLFYLWKQVESARHSCVVSCQHVNKSLKNCSQSCLTSHIISFSLTRNKFTRNLQYQMKYQLIQLIIYSRYV